MNNLPQPGANIAAAQPPAFGELDLAHSRLRICRHGLMLFLSADEIIGRALELYGEFAESENRIMASLVQPGDVVVDVGANVGTVTLALARRVGPQGRVHAFEPQRLVFQILCANTALNGLTNVEARWAAIGASAGAACVPALDPTMKTNFGAIRLATEATGEKVDLMALDDLALPRCALIKIDVEGMESEVLRGAEATIARHRPVFYFEAKSGENTRSCLAWLMERGYRLYWHFAPFFERNNFRKVERNIFGETGDINALAIPAASQIKVRLPPIAGPDADWHADYMTWLERSKTEGPA